MAGYRKIVMKSRMMGDYQVRFCERLGVKLPRPTRLRHEREAANGAHRMKEYLLQSALADC